MPVTSSTKPSSFQPVVINESPDFFQVVIGGIFCFFWILFFLFIAFIISGTGSHWIAYLVLFGFSLIGIIPIRYLLRKSGSTHIVITSDMVRFHRKNRFFRDVKWDESLQKYTGLMTKVLDFGQGERRKIIYSVRLIHPDENKCLTLGSYETEQLQRQSLELFAQRLNKSALKESDEGEIREVKPEELDLTLKERVDKGLMKEHALPPFPPGSKLVFEKIENGFMISKYYRYTWTLGFVFATVGIIFLVTRFDYIIGVILCVVAGLFFLSKGGYSRLIVTNDLIETHQFFAKRVMLKKTIDTKKVEEVTLGFDHSRGNKSRFTPSVMIASDHGIIHFAQGSSPKEREWIRDAVKNFVIAVQKANK